MTALEGAWPDRVLAMQRNWIGRSEGAYVDFRIEGRDEPVTVFTTRPDTLYGATFMVVAPDAALASEIVTDEHRAEFEAYLEKTKRATEIERQSTEREKTGVFLGVYATNPVNGEQVPVWAADYVLSEYGTGAIMAVPAHDQRDLDFAREVRHRRPGRHRHRRSRPGGVRHRDSGGRHLRQLRDPGRPARQGVGRGAHQRQAGGRRAPAGPPSPSGCATGC